MLNQRFEGEPLLKHRTRRKLLIAAHAPQCYYSTTGMDKQLRVANLIRKYDKSSEDNPRWSGMAEAEQHDL